VHSGKAEEDPMSAPVTLITGTSTGIGYATALHLARCGHTVHATMRSPERAGAALLDAAAKEGLTVSVSRLDVTDDASVEQSVAAALRESGRIDVLVNNAGIGDLGALETTSDETVYRMFETNVFGPLRTVRAVLPGMRERGSGTIVNVSSVAGRIVGAVNGLYAASKHALEAMSEALAIEVFAHGIRVAVVEPGFFDTPILDKAPGAIAPEEAGPYDAIQRRMAGLYAGARQAGAGDALDVAKAIEQAIAPGAPFRTLVGFDAVPFMEGRARMSDEEYIEAFGHEQTDEEWFAEFMRRFPMPAAAT
jgi:NAD(P)-dependent dehydrogenase (short-subunit alcohol dehydrogenase family)